MTRLLPDVRSEDDYRPLRWHTPAWLPALRALCAREGLDPDGFVRATDGTHVVFLGRDVVLKLFVRLWPEDHAREVAALGALEPAGLPVPALRAVGELEGWPYLVQTRLPGVAIKQVWPTLAPREQAHLAEELGAFLAALHEVAIEGCAPPLAADEWPTFVAERRARCLEHHARGGAGPGWLGELARALEAMPPARPERRLLHADLTADHALVHEVSGRWRLAAVIDWADAMLGAPCYDLAVPAVFLAQGRPGVGRALLRGYGLAPDHGLLDGLMHAFVLHKYGHVTAALKHAAGPPARDLRELRRALWELDA